MATVVASRFGLSAIPAFIIAGILIGEHPPLGLPSLVEESESIELLGELGIVMLLFFLGLEFSLERLRQAGRLLAVGGVIDLVVNGGLGLLVGTLLFGFGAEAVLLAGIIYISSSGIISRALFDFRRLADDETDLVLGILVFEDLAIAVFLGLAAGLATGEAAGVSDVTGSGALALGFVAVFLLAGRYAHRVIDWTSERLDSEEIVLAALALALAGAAAGELAGVSEAVGALLAGILLSGSPEVRDRIEERLLGIRDVFAGIFFFVFGISVDLSAVGPVAGWLLLAVPIAVAGKMVAGYGAARLTGFRPRRALNAGAALVARGEFSIILAQLAAAGVALDPEFREQIGIFASIFVVATALIGVLFMRESRRVGRRLFPSRAPTRPRRPQTARGHDG